MRFCSASLILNIVVAVFKLLKDVLMVPRSVGGRNVVEIFIGEEYTHTLLVIMCVCFIFRFLFNLNKVVLFIIELVF